jgi:predicted transcriptional regulator
MAALKSASSSRRGAAGSPGCDADTSNLQVVMVRGETVPRIWVHLVGNYLLRTDRERRDLHFGDLDLASIASTVRFGTVDVDPHEQVDDRAHPVSPSRQRPMNTQSVAEATGLPRETVRRKLRKLVQEGVLIAKDGGYVYRPDYAEQARQQAAFERRIRDMLMFVNLCLTRGILRLRPKPDASAKPRPAQPAKLADKPLRQPSCPEIDGAHASAPSPTYPPIDTSSLRVALMSGETAPRIFVHLAENYLLRADRERRGIYFGDLDLASIAATIGVGSLEADFRDPTFREKFNDYRNIIGPERQRPLNVQSIADATGLPRETVRRKLKALLEKGVLIRKDGGYIYKPGYAHQPRRHEAFERGLRDTQEFINRCLDTGVLGVTSNPAGEALAKAVQPAKLRQ